MDIEQLLKKLEKKLKKFVTKLVNKYLPEANTELEHNSEGNSQEEQPTEQTTPTQPQTQPQTPQQNVQETVSEDEVDFSKLDFCWGGFKGSGAKLDEKAIIKNLNVNVSGNKMTYSWSRLWGMEFTEAKALACLFIPEGNKWVGGKFDWISESRTSRDLNNIKSGYNGWSWSKFSTSKKFAFVIVSGDGKKRTNVISC